jgi:anti-sigma factor RsiW
MEFSSCPELATLRQLFDGSLPEPEQGELASHLESCASCRQTLDQLASEGDSFSGLARELQHDATAPEPGLQRVLKEADAAPGATRAEPSDESEAGTIDKDLGADVDKVGPRQALNGLEEGAGV